MFIFVPKSYAAMPCAAVIASRLVKARYIQTMGVQVHVTCNAASFVLQPNACTASLGPAEAHKIVATVA
jgi:hypothetical protein